MTCVLVFDAESKNALAAIRSLARQRVQVISGSTRRLTRGGLSRYCTAHIVHPLPSDEAAFVESVLAAVQRLGIDVLLPIGDATNRALSRHKDRLSASVAVPVADWEVMRVACQKDATFQFAETLGIPVPRTYTRISDVERFPVVVKQSLGAGGVRYVNSAAELGRVDASHAVVQDYIPGSGYGFFALFEHGRERAIFMHRRVREYPPTGGSSTAADSFYDDRLRELGLTLLRALNWHGVAMVEFKRDARDSEYKLMEINPKFWGSLDLSIAAGVDFPWLTVEMAQGNLGDDVMAYETGVRFHWVFDDFMHLAAKPSSFRDVMRDFRDGVDNDIRSDDVKPALFDAGNTVAKVIVRGATGRLRRPHGAPTGD